MVSGADAILESLIGEVKTNYSGSIDIADIIAKSGTKPKLSSSKLCTETPKDEKRKHRKKKRKSSKSDEEKSKDKEDIRDKNSWIIEPMKQSLAVHDIPVGADFKLYHSKVKDSPEKKKKNKKDKEDKKHQERKHKHKKRTNEVEEEDRTEKLSGELFSESDGGSASKAERQEQIELEEGEIVEGRRLLDSRRSERSGSADESLEQDIDKKKKQKKVKKEKKERRRKKEKGRSKEKDVWQDPPGYSKHDEHRSYGEKDKGYGYDDRRNSKDDEYRDSKRYDYKGSRHKYDVRRDREDSKRDDYRQDDRDFRHDEYHERLERHREDRTRSPKLKASGSLSKPLSPKRDSNPSSLLPTTWSKHLNGLLKSSNDEFTEDRRSHDSRRSRDDDKRHDKGRLRDRKDGGDDYRIPERRSRSKTPSVGRGRNVFRRTDEERREHQRDRPAKRRRASPVQIFEEDYTDKDGKVDSKKLMDIATKNVTKLSMSGALPKGYELLSTIKSKTVSQLIALCKKLHDEDERARVDRPSSSSEESEDEDKSYGCVNYWEDNRSFSIREPKEAPVPKHEAISGVAHQLKTLEERKADEAMLRVSYPVSSGYEHRMKELEPADDDIPQLPLMSALARIKTNISPVFVDSNESDNKASAGPTKPFPALASGSKSVADLSKAQDLVSGCNPFAVVNPFGIIPLPNPIEVGKPPESTPVSTEPVVPTVIQKPIKIRASFLKSGKKAAEEVLNKIMASNPTPVPPPKIPVSVVNAPQETVLLPPPPIPPTVLMAVEEVEPIPISPPKEPEKKEITHSDHLSALLDKMDELLNSGKIEEISKVEKKELPKESEPMEEVQTGDYVKIPGLNEPRKTEDGSEKAKKKKKKKDQETMEEVETAEELKDVDEDREAKKNRHDKETSDLKEKKRKFHEKDEEPEEKKKKSESKSTEATVLKNVSEPQKTPELNHRDPLPFIKALTNPQLAIEGTQAGSLKATWNDSGNSLLLPPVFVSNDESTPIPFRILPLPKETVVKPEDMVFRPSKSLTDAPKMINELVSKRAQFVQALMADPDDCYARNKIAEIDREMNAWAESKNIPGKFTGRTGARVLSADELGPSDPRYNAWARKDLFLNAPEHDSEFGRRIMEKYGWQKGSGLGKTLTGPVEPLSLDIKADRRGLASANDRKPGKNSTIPDINGKNPISLVMEYCAKKKLQPPTFTCIESGPANARRFLWKCIVDGVEYEPLMAAANKKTGKTEVCYVVLQALGQIPPTIPD